MRTWKTSLGLGAVLAVLFTVPVRAEDNWINWLTDYREGLRIAKETGKPMIVEFRCEA